MPIKWQLLLLRYHQTGSSLLLYLISIPLYDFFACLRTFVLLASYLPKLLINELGYQRALCAKSLQEDLKHLLNPMMMTSS